MPDWFRGRGETNVDIFSVEPNLPRVMPSLPPLLTSHGSLLVLDAASTCTQVGLLRSGAPARWHQTMEEAGTGIFHGVAAVLKEADSSLDAIGAFVFCEGPGSMLGTRTIAMALRTWQVLKPRPVYAYRSLAVAGRLEWTRRPRSFTVIADARREAWHCQPVDSNGKPRPLERRPTAGLPAGELVTPENFRAWTPLPANAASCSYDLAQIFPALADGDFFSVMAAPDALRAEAPDYRKWSAQIHRAPAARGP
ncbi:MAG: hypothetical protein JWQ62_1455 [Lacunisphaera sp.]|nr:hypothetical protein [Lacunisphaera sp.]